MSDPTLGAWVVQWGYARWNAIITAIWTRYKDQSHYWDMVAKFLSYYWYMKEIKLRVELINEESLYNKVIGQEISLWGVKNIMPGLWISDDIINTMNRKYLDDCES